MNHYRLPSVMPRARTSTIHSTPASKRTPFARPSERSRFIRCSSEPGGKPSDPLFETAHVDRQRVLQALRGISIWVPDQTADELVVKINREGRLSQRVYRFGDFEVHCPENGLPTYNSLRRAILVHVLEECRNQGATAETIIQMANDRYYTFAGDSESGHRPIDQMESHINQTCKITIPQDLSKLREELQGAERDFTILHLQDGPFHVMAMTHQFVIKIYEQNECDIKALCRFFNNSESISQMHERLRRAGVDVSIPSVISTFAPETILTVPNTAIKAELRDAVHQAMTYGYARAVAHKQNGLELERTWLDELQEDLAFDIRHQVFLTPFGASIPSTTKNYFLTRAWFHLQGLIIKLFLDESKLNHLDHPHNLLVQNALRKRLGFTTNLIPIFFPKDYVPGEPKPWAKPLATLESLEALFLHLRHSGCLSQLYTHDELENLLVANQWGKGPNPESVRLAQSLHEERSKKGKAIDYNPAKPDDVTDAIQLGLVQAIQRDNLQAHVSVLVSEMKRCWEALNNLQILYSTRNLEFLGLPENDPEMLQKMATATNAMGVFVHNFETGLAPKTGIKPEDQALHLAREYSKCVAQLHQVYLGYQTRSAPRWQEDLSSCFDLYRRIYIRKQLDDRTAVIGPLPQELTLGTLHYATILLPNLPQEQWEKIPVAERYWLVTDGPGLSHGNHVLLAYQDFHIERRKRIEAALGTMPEDEKRELLSAYLNGMMYLRMKVVAHPQDGKPIFVILNQDAGKLSDAAPQHGGALPTREGALWEFGVKHLRDDLGVPADRIVVLTEAEEMGNERLIENIQARFPKLI